MRNIIVYTLMFSAMLQLLMAVYAWGRRNEPAAKPFIAVCLIGCFWAFAYGVEMASNDIQVKILSVQIHWMIVAFGPLALLLLVFEHLEITHLLTRWRLAFLLTPPLLITALVWTYPLHELFLYNFTIDQFDALSILHKETGVLFMPIVLALQGISLITYYYLIRSLASTNHIKRQQSIAILLAQLILFLVNGLKNLDISPLQGFDFTPHTLVISSALYAFAIFRYRWLDIIPLARTTLVEVIPAGVIVLDEKNRIVDINPFARELLQVTESIIGEKTQNVFAQFNFTFHAETRQEKYKKEIKIGRNLEQLELFEANVMPLKDSAGQFKGHIIMLHDITERKRAEITIQDTNQRLYAQLNEIESLHAQLREQAIRDSLTGLFNRRYLDEMLEQEIQRAERYHHPLSLIMLDVNSFKKFNDTFGHKAGDLILKTLGELIQSGIRKGDIACRYGGDEFTLILPEIGLVAAQQCADRLRQDIYQMKIEFNGQTLRNITAAIGVAAFPEHGSTGSLMLQSADRAMYQTKQRGELGLDYAQA